MTAAYYDFFRKITLQPDGVTLEADSVSDTLTITGGNGVAFNPNVSADSFEIDVNYQLFVPIGSTKIRLNDINSNYTDITMTAGSNMSVGRNSANELVFTSTVGGTSKAVSGATQASPVVITTNTQHQFTEGIAVTITDIVGMTELNGNEYYMDILTSQTFALYTDSNLTTPLNGTGFTAYGSGGVAVAEYSAPQALSQLNDVDLVGTPPVNGTYLQYNGTSWQAGTTLAGDLTGSVFADDSTLLVDGVGGKVMLTTNTTTELTEGTNLYYTDVRADARITNAGSANWNTAFGWGNHASAGYQVAGAPHDGDIEGSVFGDDSTLLVDAVNNLIPATVISGTLANDTTGNAATATKLATARLIGGVSFDGIGDITLPGVNSAGNQNITGDAAGDHTGTFTGNVFTTLIDSADSSAIVITPSLRTSSDVAIDQELRVGSTNTTGPGGQTVVITPGNGASGTGKVSTDVLEVKSIEILDADGGIVTLTGELDISKTLTTNAGHLGFGPNNLLTYNGVSASLRVAEFTASLETAGAFDNAANFNNFMTVDSASAKFGVPVQFGSYTTTQRNALAGVVNGLVIYNSTDDKFQGRAGGAWVNLH